ncbi:hypothetical protein HKX48_006759 [Thoreauomyces humboldtii]|nr:hypothetical protein HKX48_006759 [Thoreauomyces humboldtii]
MHQEAGPTPALGSRYGHSLYALHSDPHGPECSIAAQSALLIKLAKTHSLGLLVGRGVDEESRWWTPDAEPLQSSTDTLWIPTDVFGGAFSTPPKGKTPQPHLWLDFTNPLDLAQIPTALVHSIVFDISTWRYMRPAHDPAIVRHWARILVPGGTMAFDAEVASVAGGERKGYESENPTHIMLPSDDSSALAFFHALKSPRPGVKRTVIPAPKVRGPRHPEVTWLADVYRKVLVGENLFESVVLVEDQEYPVKTRGCVEPWFMAVKTAGDTSKSKHVTGI